ncbi:hypothetical protein PFISCL1PPCAC_28718, partial [Pristionchus fissidentatus]
QDHNTRGVACPSGRRAARPIARHDHHPQVRPEGGNAAKAGEEEGRNEESHGCALYLDQTRHGRRGLRYPLRTKSVQEALCEIRAAPPLAGQGELPAEEGHREGVSLGGRLHRTLFYVPRGNQGTLIDLPYPRQLSISASTDLKYRISPVFLFSIYTTVSLLIHFELVHSHQNIPLIVTLYSNCLCVSAPTYRTLTYRIP